MMGQYPQHWLNAGPRNDHILWGHADNCVGYNPEMMTIPTIQSSTLSLLVLYAHIRATECQHILNSKLEGKSADL